MDKLTPGVLRDLADVVGHRYNLAQDLREEAARREADAPCETCNDDPAVCADVPGLRHCEKAQREEPAPSPDADDLMTSLRHYASNLSNPFGQTICAEAADRIEAQADKIEGLDSDLSFYKMRCEEVAAERDALKARVARLEDALRCAVQYLGHEGLLRDRLKELIAGGTDNG